MKEKIQPIFLNLSEQRASEVHAEMQSVLASDQQTFVLLPPMTKVSELDTTEAEIFLIVADDFADLQTLLSTLSLKQLGKTILYGQSGQHLDTLLQLPVVGFIPDRTIDETRRIREITGYSPTRRFLVGYGLYGLKKLNDPKVFNQNVMEFSEASPFGYFTLADEERKFELGETLNLFAQKVLANY